MLIIKSGISTHTDEFPALELYEEQTEIMGIKLPSNP